MNILKYKDISPTIDQTSFVADTARVIGDVQIGEDCGVWFGAVIRGDVNDIKIGNRTNVQDNAMIHCTTNYKGTYIGDDVTIGHMAMLHACNIGNKVLVGMKACLMDGVVIDDYAMVAAGALVTPGKHIKSGELWGGSPARYMRDLTEKERAHIDWSAPHYAALAKEYM
jgi:carbonic anhydrase/acetyltransferase-like protein (isoleucine patch superfamily)